MMCLKMFSFVDKIPEQRTISSKTWDRFYGLRNITVNFGFPAKGTIFRQARSMYRISTFYNSGGYYFFPPQFLYTYTEAE